MESVISGARMRRFGVGGIMFVAALGLAGCTNPYNPGQRALGGAAIGAGGGALLGAATGGSPATGALLGGVVGAAAGALTTPQRGGYNRQRYNNRGYDSQGRYNQNYDRGY